MTGLTVKAIRVYERERVIQEPKRNLSGYRLYKPEDIETLLQIKHLRGVGCTLNECKAYLNGEDKKSLLKQKLVDVSHQITNLQNSSVELRKMLDRLN